jgi:dipeptidyl aminopeptidase/acylaminoacyl peptidase
MPWVGSELMLADVVLSGNAFAVENVKTISGERGKVSVGQPHWASDDVLLFLNDTSGYVNPWSHSISSSETGPIIDNPVSEDFSEPAWRLGSSDFAVLNADKVLLASTRDGRSVLYLATLSTRSLIDVTCPYSVVQQVRLISPHEVVFLASKDDESNAIVRVILNDNGVPTYEVVKSVDSAALPHDIISKPQAYALPMPPSNDPVHVLYYPPFNPRFVPVDHDVPPAVVSIHGGPTGRSLPGLRWEVQYWTSRGWAWSVYGLIFPCSIHQFSIVYPRVEVDYGGSSGYGRKYRYVVVVILICP